MKYFEKVAYPPKSNIERVMTHYNVSEKKAKKMLEEKHINELLPERGRKNPPKVNPQRVKENA